MDPGLRRERWDGCLGRLLTILEILSKANAKGPHVLSYTLLLTRMHGCATPGWEQGAKLTMQSDSCVWYLTSLALPLGHSVASKRYTSLL